MNVYTFTLFMCVRVFKQYSDADMQYKYLHICLYACIYMCVGACVCVSACVKICRFQQ